MWLSDNNKHTSEEDFAVNEWVFRPELAASGQAAVLAVRSAVCRVVMRVSVGDVEAETFLTPFFLRRLSMAAQQAVLFFQAAQRQASVDGLEDDGPDHLRWIDVCGQNPLHKRARAIDQIADLTCETGFLLPT